MVLRESHLLLLLMARLLPVERLLRMLDLVPGVVGCHQSGAGRLILAILLAIIYGVMLLVYYLVALAVSGHARRVDVALVSKEVLARSSLMLDCGSDSPRQASWSRRFSFSCSVSLLFW